MGEIALLKAFHALIINKIYLGGVVIDGYGKNFRTRSDGLLGRSY